MRDAPSLVILPMLQARGARVRAYDPQGGPRAQDCCRASTWCESALDAAEGADVLVVLTEWNEFRALDLRRPRQDAGNVLVDLRNVYQRLWPRQAGFVYYGVGRGVSRRIANGASQRPRERGYEAGRSSQVTAAYEGVTPEFGGPSGRADVQAFARAPTNGPARCRRCWCASRWTAPSKPAA